MYSHFILVHQCPGRIARARKNAMLDKAIVGAPLDTVNLRFPNAARPGPGTVPARRPP